jgi:cysteinyl-tRNA synthetase
MSKSLGNLVSIRDALKDYSSDAIRASVLKSHYRGPGYYSDESLAENERSLTRLRQALLTAPNAGASHALDAAQQRDRFVAAMDDDMNTPQALATLFDMARDINRGSDKGQDVAAAQAVLRALGADVFGFTFEQHQAEVSDDQSAQIQELVERRTMLRGEKKFTEADVVRDELAAMGVVLTDSADGTSWRIE